MTVPALSIAFMAVSALIAIGVPIGLFIFLHNKYGSKIIPALVGAAAFIIFALILESLMHKAVLHPDASGNIALKSQPLLFMLYAGFAAGLFEETARFLSFHLLKKRYNKIDTGLAYGVGHGGAESIILAGLGMISSLVLSFSINSGAAAAMQSKAQGAALTALNAQIDSLTSTASYMFLFAGGERILSIAVQIALSVIVFYAVMAKGKWWLYPLAIVLHAVTDFSAALFQAGVIKSVFAVEGFVAVCAVLLVILAVFIHRKLRPAVPEAAFEGA